MVISRSMVLRPRFSILRVAAPPLPTAREKAPVESVMV